MDSILVRPIDAESIIGVETCDQESLDYCIKLPQFDNSIRWYLPIGNTPPSWQISKISASQSHIFISILGIFKSKQSHYHKPNYFYLHAIFFFFFFFRVGFLVLAPSHPLIYGALSFFDSRYNPDLWPCGTIYLTLSYAKLALNTNTVPTRKELSRVLPDRSDLVTILPREAFYPVAWQKVVPYFDKDDAELWQQITRESYAFHIWGKMTAHKQPAKGSLLWQVLNSFSISNTPPSETIPM